MATFCFLGDHMADIETMRSVCLKFKAAAEDVKWENNLVFSVGDKMFCMANLEPPFRFSFKVADEDFEELSTRDGFMPAPYLARAKWITVVNMAHLKRSELEDFLFKSYELVAAKLPKKLKQALNL